MIEALPIVRKATSADLLSFHNQSKTPPGKRSEIPTAVAIAAAAKRKPATTGIVFGLCAIALSSNAFWVVVRLLTRAVLCWDFHTDSDGHGTIVSRWRMVRQRVRS